MRPDAEKTRELLARARDNDADAVNELLLSHREPLRRLIGLRMDRALQRRVDASDIVQDAMIVASRRLAEYLREPPMPFHLWLWHLARDRIMDAHRRHRGAARRSMDREQPLAARGSEDAGLDLAALVRDREMTPGAAALSAELKERVRAAIDALDAQDREVVEMRHFGQLTNQEVAQALGLSEPAAGMRFLRAVRRLWAILEERPSREGPA